MFVWWAVRSVSPSFVWPLVPTGCGRSFKLLLGCAEGCVEHDSESIIRTEALPGTAFLDNGRTTAYVRASFSLLPSHQVDEALRRLRAVVRPDPEAQNKCVLIFN